MPMALLLSKVRGSKISFLLLLIMQVNRVNMLHGHWQLFHFLFVNFEVQSIWLVHPYIPVDVSISPVDETFPPVNRTVLIYIFLILVCFGAVKG